MRFSKTNATLPVCLVAVLFSALLGCGGRSTQETVSEPEDKSPGSSAAKTNDSLAVEGLRGTIPKEDVVRVFDRHMDELLDCYSDALEDLEEIEGEVSLFFLVDPQGGVKQVHIRQSSLGSLRAEQCILGHVSRYTFPEPAGGAIAEVSYSMAFEAPYDNPPPLQWEPSVVDSVVHEHEDAVERCIGNRTGINITSYVGRGGVVLTSGVAASEGKDIDAGRCLAEEMRNWEFPDPGHKLAKVEVAF